jgi:hypothetical protein
MNKQSMNSVSENAHVLLQHARTRMFYVRDGDWTRDPSQARDFGTTQAAFIYSRALGMAEAEAVHFLPYHALQQQRVAA